MLGRRPGRLMLIPIISFSNDLSFTLTAWAIHNLMPTLISSPNRASLSFSRTITILKTVGLHVGLLDMLIPLGLCESLGLREGVGAF